MDNMTSLNLDEMEKVSGGVHKTIQGRSATVFTGPGTEYGVTTTLSGGTVVNFTGNVSYSDHDGSTKPLSSEWVMINSPISGWVTREAIGV